MPAAKKAGSARRSPAKTAATEAKKPGPKPGAKRAPRGSRPQKTFLLYAVDGNELSFLAESQGATGHIAAVNAVKEGKVDPNTPVVPLAPRAVKRIVEVEAEERGVVYKAKSVGGTKRAPRKTSARKAAASSPATDGGELAPGEAPANPFA